MLKPLKIGSDLVIKLLDKIQNYEKITRIKQDDKFATYAKKIAKSEEEINWHNDVIIIYNQIRGLSPKPSAYFYS